MILAEIDATGWGLIIAAVVLGVDRIYSLYIGAQREKDKLIREAAAAAEVAKVARRARIAAKGVTEVKTTLETATTEAKTDRATTEKTLAAVVAKVDLLTVNVETVVLNIEKVHRATNSLTEQLVAKTEAEAHARGEKDERDRTRARENPNPPAAP